MMAGWTLIRRIRRAEPNPPPLLLAGPGGSAVIMNLPHTVDGVSRAARSIDPRSGTRTPHFVLPLKQAAVSPRSGAGGDGGGQAPKG